MRLAAKLGAGLAVAGLALTGLTLVVGLARGASQPRASNRLLSSAVVSLEKAKKESFAWGTLHSYFTKESYGTRDGLAAVAVIQPGRQIHPPHKHAEEEYLMVLEGTGTWSLNGRSFPARSGDMLYAAPWDLHGIKNTGKSRLKFAVWKWNGKRDWRPPAPPTD